MFLSVPLATDHKLLVNAGKKLPIPLSQVHCQVYVRPMGWSLDWCRTPLTWHNVTRPGNHADFNRHCGTKGGEMATYRFCVSVYRQHYPVNIPQPRKGAGLPADTLVLPGHVMTVLPPVRLENLLPLEMTYYVKNTDIRGSVKPGEIASLVVVSNDMASICDWVVKLVIGPLDGRRARCPMT